MKKLKLFEEFLNEWYLKNPENEIFNRSDIEASIGYGSLVSLEYDANRIKALLWLYFLTIGSNKKDGFGFDRFDKEFWTKLGAKLITHGSLTPIEMELLRSKMFYYVPQITKIVNYERKMGKDEEIEKYVHRWIKQNENKYKVEEKPLPPKDPKQGSLF